MANNNRSRKGSLQFYPRVRAKKPLPNVNWDAHTKDTETKSLRGFIGYKVGMVSVFAKDNTNDAMTKGKRITIPATVIECPTMKVYSVRFYEKGRVVKDVIVANDKELKRKVRVAKKLHTLEHAPEAYDDIRVLVYSNVKETSIGKKKPDMIEFGLSGSLEEKMQFVTDKMGKEISVAEVFKSGLIDVHAVTKGFGTQGTVKRFGVSLKDHKSEKGRRRPGSLSSFGLRRVTFRAPMAGQTGFHNRVAYNNLILDVGTIKEKDINKKGGFTHYGNISGDYLILKGSIPGPKKRGLVLTFATRPTKHTSKRSFEVLEVR